MKNTFLKIKGFVFAHKILSIIILILLLLTSYWTYSKITNKTGVTRYVMGTVTKTTITSSVSGSGQVSTQSQVDLKPTVSGDVVNILVKPGDKVASGTLLFSIDNTNAQKTMRDAQANLEAAKLDLKTAQTQNENTDINQKTAIDNAYNALLNSSFEATPDTSNTISTNTNLSAPIISGNYTLGKEGIINIHFYPSSGGTSFSVSGLTNGSSISSTSFATPIGNSGLYLTLPSNNNFGSISDWVINIPNKKASNYQSNYNAYQQALQNQNQTSSNSALNQLNIEAKKLAVKQKENALQDAKDNLSNYYIRAPFSGTIASIPIQVGDNVSSATVLGTIITAQKLANITLNEVDVAKIALGQKVNITFDAISDLNMTGKVVQIDSIGTVSSGVVNYTVKINFDTDDTRIKSGMSVNATIITNMHQNVLTVPNSAVKKQNDTSYVQIFTDPLPTPSAGTQGSPSTTPPIKQTVEIGIADDVSTEIISGLKEGDSIVVKTITSNTTTASTAPSIFGAATGNKGGGATGGNATRALKGN